MPPAITEAQRAEALRKAAAVRSARRAFKDGLANGEHGLASAIAIARSDEALAGTRVRDLLESLPGIGPKRAAAIMAEIGIAPTRRVRGLGQAQVAALVTRMAS